MRAGAAVLENLADGENSGSVGGTRTENWNSSECSVGSTDSDRYGVVVLPTEYSLERVTASQHQHQHQQAKR